MAKKKRGGAHGGGHGWFVTFADLMGLMMSFFVMLVAFSTMDNNKLKIVAGSMRDAFGTQTAVRYSGIVESDGLPTRPKMKNVEHISPEDSSANPSPDDKDKQPTLAKPTLKNIQDEVDGKVDEKLVGVPMRFLVPLNREGGFLSQLKATDNISKKSSIVYLPLRVFPAN